MLFLAYQKSIATQFEFVQKTWVNEPKFPPELGQTSAVPGQDPIIAQSKDGPFELKAGTSVDVKHFVKTTGGEYFFAPSISTLAAF